jgi:hypothetical protein
MSSGIPMVYDTLGTQFTFETAGMFTLKAKSKKGETLAIKNGQKIQVNLSTDKSDEKFNFYQLNEQTGDWTYNFNDFETSNNERYTENKRLIKPTKSTTKNPFVLDLSFDLSNYPELEPFNGIMWEYTGNNDSLDPRINNKFKSKWTKFDLTPTKENAYEYFLKMSNKRNSFVTKVKAILNGEDLDLAIAKYNKAKIEFEKKVENLQKPFIRSVEIGGFGTYNYDYVYHIDNPAKIIADFEFETESEKDHALVIVIYEKEDVVVNYPKDKWELFSLDKSSSPKIIAILPENKIAVYKGSMENVYKHSKFTFKMETLPNKVNNKVDILKAIQSI